MQPYLRDALQSKQVPRERKDADCHHSDPESAKHDILRLLIHGPSS